MGGGGGGYNLTWRGTNSMACMYFTEFAENGSTYDYIHKEHKKPPLSQMLLWAIQVAEGMYLRPIKGTKCCLPGVVAVVFWSEKNRQEIRKRNFK